MTAVPALLPWDCVGYCANAAATAARQKASNPNPRRILADRVTSLWLVDIVIGSFSLIRNYDIPAKDEQSRNQARPDPRAHGFASRSSKLEKMSRVTHEAFRHIATLNQFRILTPVP